MATNKLRISLSEKHGHIEGVVDLPADPGFILESLVLVVERFSVQTGVPPTEILNDIRSFIEGKVK